MTRPLRSTGRARAAVATFIALVAMAGHVNESFAGPPRAMKPEARAALDRGVAAYERGDFDAASAALREAITIEPHPDLYYTLGQSERRAGRCDAAAEAYRAFLASSPPASEADLARSNIDRCVPAKPPAPPRVARDPKPALEPVDDGTVAAAGYDPGGENYSLIIVPSLGVCLTIFGVVALGLGEGAASSAAEAKNLDEFRDAATRTDVWRVTGGLSIAAGVAIATGILVDVLVVGEPDAKKVSLRFGPSFVGVAGNL